MTTFTLTFCNFQFLSLQQRQVLVISTVPVSQCLHKIQKKRPVTKRTMSKRMLNTRRQIILTTVIKKTIQEV